MNQRPQQLPPMWLVIASFGILVFAVVVSAVQLRHALDSAATGATLTWTRHLWTFSSMLAVALILLFSRQLPAFAYAALARRHSSRVAVVVTGWGNATLAAGSKRRGLGGYFSRCLLADENQLTLWHPIRGSSVLDWADVAKVSIQSSIEVDGVQPVIQVERKHPYGTLRFMPQSRRFVGLGTGETEQAQNDLAAIKDRWAALR